MVSTVQRTAGHALDEGVTPMVAGRLRCPVCSSDDVAVLPQGVVDTAIVCRSCGSTFLVSIMAPPRPEAPVSNNGASGAPPAAGAAGGGGLPPGGGSMPGSMPDGAGMPPMPGAGGGSPGGPDTAEATPGQPAGATQGAYAERSYTDAATPDQGAVEGDTRAAARAAEQAPTVRKQPGAGREALVKRARGKGWGTYHGPLYEDDVRTETFYRRIGSIMSDNKFDRKVGGKRSGELNPRSLYKVPTGNGRVFQRPQERQNKRYNVILLVDTSGSMEEVVTDAKHKPVQFEDGDYYTRYHMVADLTRMLTKGLSRHNINFSVVTFGGGRNKVEPLILKRFDDACDPEQLHFDITYAQPITGRSGNFDFAGIATAYAMLASKADEQNIVMVLADGGVYRTSQKVKHPVRGTLHDAGDGTLIAQRTENIKQSDGTIKPVTSEGFKGKPLLKRTATELERLGRVITIGINTREVLDWYPNAHPVNSYEEFMEVTLREFGRCIVRG